MSIEPYLRTGGLRSEAQPQSNLAFRFRREPHADGRLEGQRPKYKVTFWIDAARAETGLRPSNKASIRELAHQLNCATVIFLKKLFNTGVLQNVAGGRKGVGDNDFRATLDVALVDAVKASCDAAAEFFIQ